MRDSGTSLTPNPRIAIGGIWHETNTFASDVTRYRDFESYQFALEQELIDLYSNTNTELGGMISESNKFGIDPVPTLFAAAVPSGIIEQDSFLRLVDELTELIRKSLPLDGVALALHGAAAAEHFDDADAYILERVRQVVGNQIPIVATFDYHANLSESMVQSASALIGYDTYPHVDMADRGMESVRLISRLIKDKSTLRCAFRKLPLLTSPLKQQTDVAPMLEVMQRLHELESNPAITCASVAMGFPYSDVAHLGASVVVYGHDTAAVNCGANSIATQLWDARLEFHDDILSVEESVRMAAASAQFPVVIVEPADNIGGGSAGDGTGVLRELLKSRADRSVIVVCDPETVEQAEQAGVGEHFVAKIGGKSDDQHGAPVEAKVVVKSISDGEYVHKGSYMTGYITSMGRTALVESDGVQIVLTSKRSMPFDAEQLRCLGIEPEEQKIIVVKAAIAWKAAYGDIARRVLIVDTPGVCAAELSRLKYRKRPQPLYPLEQDTNYSP